MPARPVLFAALLACASAAAAQQAGPGGRTVYEAAYFATYSPSNALEIVKQVPGFTIELIAEDVRGFGRAAGNVVINGSRPSSKSDTIETILARIPASSVARVEVGPGDLYSSEFAGKPQVLNLVLTDTGGLAGTVTATLRRDYTGQLTPEGNISALYRTGRSSFNVSAGLTNEPFPENGFDRIVTLPERELVEFREKFNDIQEHEAFVSGSWEHDAGENRTAHVNFRAAKGKFYLKQYNDVFPVDGPIRDDRLIQDFPRTDYELGGDVTRPLFGGGLKLIGLATRRHRPTYERSLNRIEGEVLGGFEQEADNQRNETILRAIWSRNYANGWNVELGAEGALNTLDSDVNLYLLDADLARTRIDLPIDQAKVTEWRAESFINAGRNLSPALRMDLGLVFESSHLNVTGDAEASNLLRFLKPKIVFDWNRAPWHAQISLIRTVAQLNFDDFITTAELTNDRVDAGNANLEPQRAWEALLMVERPILGEGLVKVELGYNIISKLQDRVPTPEGFDAPGNIGTGKQAFARGTLAAPLGRFGIKGGRLDLKGTIQDTSVRDPYTGRKRSFSGIADWAFEASFRQDLGKFAWGINLFTNPSTTYFRRDETDKPDFKEPWVNVFAEYRPSARTTITLGLDNILEKPGNRYRTFYFPDRSNLDPYEFEYRERNRHVTAYIRFKQSFGS
jgi:hypothetical protein